MKLKLFKGIGNGAASNSLILVMVSAVTIFLGIVTSKLLSVHFTLYEYGTYAQVMLVNTTVTSVTSFGLGNATNYFFNKSADIDVQQQYVSTLFIIEEIIGLLCGLLIFLSRRLIAIYFNNNNVKHLVIIVAFMPLLSHLITTYQHLFVSIGKAKTIAVRNLLVSCIRLVSVIFTCYVVHDVKVILIVLLLSDIIQMYYFGIVFKRTKFVISTKYFSPQLISEILHFSVPLSIYTVTGTLNNDIDKYVIGYFANTDMLAIYTNASKRLPFDVITTSFVTVLIPIMTRLLNSENVIDAKKLFSSYLRLGCIVSIICGGGCIAFSNRIMVLLYDKKYLPGLPIFIIYLIIEMVRFANVTIVLSATGQTKIMMYTSLGSLVLNSIFNVASFKVFGIFGPAIVTLIISVCSTCVLLYFGARTLKSSVFNLFKFDELILIGLETSMLGLIMNYILNYIDRFMSLPTISTLFILLLFGIILIIINYKAVYKYIRDINQYK